MSNIRKNYVLKLVFRCIVLMTFFVFCFVWPEIFDVLNGMNFFKTLSPLHILWILWMADMLLQIFPIKSKIALGSQKMFANRFRPTKGKINKHDLKAHIIKTTTSAYIVFILWCALIAAIGLLYHFEIITKMWLFMFSIAFYVCDLICVLIWCPFRLMMKTRCCTTCRIFNWDHLMMFSPLIFMGGFYAISLVTIAFITWFMWELCIIIYPERFWDKSNQALKCSECTDKLCAQYCQKLRK